MADTLLMVDPNEPGSAFRIPRDTLSKAQADGLMLGEEWQNDKGEKHYIPLAGRADAIKMGLTRPPGSKLTSEERLSETIPPVTEADDLPVERSVMDKVRQGVQGALGDPGIENLMMAVPGGMAGSSLPLGAQKVAGKLLTRAAPVAAPVVKKGAKKAVAAPPAKTMDEMLSDLAGERGSFKRKIVNKIID